MTNHTPPINTKTIRIPTSETTGDLLKPPPTTRQEILSHLSDEIVSDTADTLQFNGFDHWATTDEYDENIDHLARQIFGRHEELEPRQRSLSKRIKRHNTLDAVIKREELSTGNFRAQQTLADPEVYPPHKPIRHQHRLPPAPINQDFLCTGSLEDDFRKELNLPSVWEECHRRLVADEYGRIETDESRILLAE